MLALAIGMSCPLEIGQGIKECVMYLYTTNSPRHFTLFEVMFGRKAILPVDLAEDTV